MHIRTINGPYIKVESSVFMLETHPKGISIKETNPKEPNRFSIIIYKQEAEEFLAALQAYMAAYKGVK